MRWKPKSKVLQGLSTLFENENSAPRVLRAGIILKQFEWADRGCRSSPIGRNHLFAWLSTDGIFSPQTAGDATQMNEESKQSESDFPKSFEER